MLSPQVYTNFQFELAMMRRFLRPKIILMSLLKNERSGGTTLQATFSFPTTDWISCSVAESSSWNIWITGLSWRRLFSGSLTSKRTVSNSRSRKVNEVQGFIVGFFFRLDWKKALDIKLKCGKQVMNCGIQRSWNQKENHPKYKISVEHLVLQIISTEVLC